MLSKFAVCEQLHLWVYQQLSYYAYAMLASTVNSKDALLPVRSHTHTQRLNIS